VKNWRLARPASRKYDTIIKVISRDIRSRKKKGDGTFVFEFDADVERSIAASAGRGSVNPRAANNPRPKNPPSKKEIRSDRPSTPTSSKRPRGWDPSTTKLAKSGSLAILKSVPRIAPQLTPSTRPAREQRGPPRAERGSREVGRQGTSNEVAGKKVRRIKEGDKTAGDVSSFAAPASSSVSHSRVR